MNNRIPYPQELIQKEFNNFVKRNYGTSEFPQFEAVELFFQEYFNTSLRLNDFKNMPHHVKDSGLFEHTGKKKNPRTNRLNNYYRRNKNG